MNNEVLKFTKKIVKDFKANSLNQKWYTDVMRLI